MLTIDLIGAFRFLQSYWIHIYLTDRTLSKINSLRVEAKLFPEDLSYWHFPFPYFIIFLKILRMTIDPLNITPLPILYIFMDLLKAFRSLVRIALFQSWK